MVYLGQRCSHKRLIYRIFSDISWKKFREHKLRNTVLLDLIFHLSSFLLQTKINLYHLTPILNHCMYFYSKLYNCLILQKTRIRFLQNILYRLFSFVIKDLYFTIIPILYCKSYVSCFSPHCVPKLPNLFKMPEIPLLYIVCLDLRLRTHNFSTLRQ